MAFLTGFELHQKLRELRMANKIGPLFRVFQGIGRKSSLRRKPQALRMEAPGSGEQECFRRRNGGFYDVRKRSVFP